MLRLCESAGRSWVGEAAYPSTLGRIREEPHLDVIREDTELCPKSQLIPLNQKHRRQPVFLGEET